MTSSSPQLPGLPYGWQEEKRIRSSDRVWIVTDTLHFRSAMYGRSTPQQFFKVGGLDLPTRKLGYFLFTTDDVKAMLKAGLPPAPWKKPLPSGIELTRYYHGPKEQGRFREMVSLVDLDPELMEQGPRLRGYFERRLYFTGNSSPGMWKELEVRAAELRAIETVALSMIGWFAAGDVKAKIGKDANVTPTLTLLVEEGHLVPNGKRKRGARYMVASQTMVERADWTE